MLSAEVESRLKHPKWQIRNQAIKTLGQTNFEASKQHLLEILKDRRPATWIKRMLGEPCHQVGFIRRNAWTALQKQDLNGEEFLEVLPVGLADQYFEVRTATWNTLGVMFNKGHWSCPEEWKNKLKVTVHKEKNFEIFLAMLPVLEHLMSNDEILFLSVKVRKFKPWRVRGAYLDLLYSLYKSDRLSYGELKPHINTVHLRSDYFKPTFLLKEKRQNLDKLIEVGK